MTRHWLGAAFLSCVLAVPPGSVAEAQTLVLKGGTVYASPEATPISDSVIVTSAGVITAVGRAGEVQIPPDARVIDCSGQTIVAGFWNSHVHFTEAVWRNADSAPAAPLISHMQEMLTQWGFTTVWSLGSNPSDSLALRRRVNAVGSVTVTYPPRGPVVDPEVLAAIATASRDHERLRLKYRSHRSGQSSTGMRTICRRHGSSCSSVATSGSDSCRTLTRPRRLCFTRSTSQAGAQRQTGSKWPSGRSARLA